MLHSGLGDRPPRAQGGPSRALLSDTSRYSALVMSDWFAPTVRRSESGRAALEHPWHLTPLGDPSTWDESLRHAVRTCLATDFPVLVTWGPEHTMIFNDAYRDLLGATKKIGALGAPLRTVIPESWDTVGPMFERVMATREPVGGSDLPMRFDRSGFDEETFFTFSYSALVDSAGHPAGVLTLGTETTGHVVALRRLRTLDELHRRLQTARGGAVERTAIALDVLEDCPDLAHASILLAHDGGLHPVRGSDASLDFEEPLELYHSQALSRRQTVRVNANVIVPLTVEDGAQAAGLFVAEGSPSRPADESLVTFVELIAASIAGVLRSVNAQQASLDARDARTALAEAHERQTRATSIALQQSMLTTPVQPEGLDLAAWYEPSRDDLQIGGDWYDSFITKNGCATLVIGDVTGHDDKAAAAMGQLRGLIRAIAFDSEQDPARVFERTDTAIQGLALGSHVTATAALVQIEPPSQGPRTVRWTNAGHPYPALVRADGSVELLQRRNDPPLGIRSDLQRTQHEVDLTCGDTLVLYTDGLVERRREHLSTGFAALREALTDGHTQSVVDLGQHVLDILAPTSADDVAIVVVRVRQTQLRTDQAAGPSIPRTAGRL